MRAIFQTPDSGRTTRLDSRPFWSLTTATACDAPASTLTTEKRSPAPDRLRPTSVGHDVPAAFLMLAWRFLVNNSAQIALVSPLRAATLSRSTSCVTRCWPASAAAASSLLLPEPHPPAATAAAVRARRHIFLPGVRISPGDRPVAPRVA